MPIGSKSHSTVSEVFLQIGKLCTYSYKNALSDLLTDAHQEFLRTTNEAVRNGLGSGRPARFMNIENLWNLRTDPNRKDYFHLLVALFFPVLHGRCKWKKMVDEKPISDFFHASTEAMVYLVLENNYDYWLRWAEQK
jgi:hypothetical protein